MKAILFFDTETTGKADFKSSYESESQPRIVQLAALLMSPDAQEIMSMSVVIRPDGWTIPDEAAAIHGITTEYAESVGVPVKTALALFGRMKRSAEWYVAHNIDFDRLVLLSEFYRAFGGGFSIPQSQCFCTMKAMTDRCKIPGNCGFKWPKLVEAHQFAFQIGIDGAHNALTDAMACSRIYFWLQGQKQQAVSHSERV